MPTICIGIIEIYFHLLEAIVLCNNNSLYALDIIHVISDQIIIGLINSYFENFKMIQWASHIFQEYLTVPEQNYIPDTLSNELPG